MVVHIVMFQFKDDEKEKHITKAADMLNRLIESVPTLRSMEVGKNFNESDRAMDLSIITSFDDKEGLQEYAIHPEHLKVVEYIKGTATLSKVVDYIK